MSRNNPQTSCDGFISKILYHVWLKSIDEYKSHYWIQSCLLPFLKMGITLPFFHSSGKIDASKQFLKKRYDGFAIDSLESKSILIEIPSCPWALFALSVRIISMLLMLKSSWDSLLLLTKDWVFGTVLSVTIFVHWNVLKISALDKKLVTNYPFVNRGGMDGYFVH